MEPAEVVALIEYAVGVVLTAGVAGLGFLILAATAKRVTS